MYLSRAFRPPQGPSILTGLLSYGPFRGATNPSARSAIPTQSSVARVGFTGFYNSRCVRRIDTALYPVYWRRELVFKRKTGRRTDAGRINQTTDDGQTLFG
jgi:hypothetical protein